MGTKVSVGPVSFSLLIIIESCGDAVHLSFAGRFLSIRACSDNAVGFVVVAVVVVSAIACACAEVQFILILP